MAFALPADARTRAACDKRYAPERGQDGKDVIWVPTEDAMVGRMLEMAKVTAADTVYDLGSGDGKIPIAAAKHFGATAVGIEYDARLVKYAQCLVAAEGLKQHVKVIQGDIFEADFSDATVVTLYLLPELNLRLRPTLLAMPPGTRVVSYSFTMGEWKPDDFIDSDGQGSAYLWIVPARIDGAWTFRSESGASFDAELEQTFQEVTGTFGGTRINGKVAGTAVTLNGRPDEPPLRLTGSLIDGRIEATFTRDAQSERYVGTRR